MDEAKNIVCTICGSYHLTKVSEIEYQCDHCGSIIRKEKAENLGKKLQELLEEGKVIDINNLRILVKKSLEGHIDRDSLIKYSNEILRILPEDVLSMFYIKFAYRDTKPLDYENYLLTLTNNATKTEINEIINLIISNVKLREKEIVYKVSNFFYGNDYDEAIEKSLLQRTKEIELFSDIKRDIFICWQSKDKDKAIEVLNALENDGYTCWISLRNIPWDTDNYWSNITKAIKSCDIFLCISSINTIQSRDCVKEVEIASSLNKKKRIEYKIDDSKDITLFKAFFTGQWITNIDDLLLKVYELKNKENKLKNNAIQFLENKDYKKARELFDELKSLSDDEEIDRYINVISTIESALRLMNTNMYTEARMKLIQINDIRYTKDLLDECTINIKSDDGEKESSNNTEKKDDLIKIKFLLDNSKDYETAEKLLYEKLAYNQNNYELWMLYLKAITQDFKYNVHKNTVLAFKNLSRLCPEEEKENLGKLDEDLNPVTIQKRIDEENRRIYEEQLRKQKEEDEKRRIKEEIDKEEREKQRLIDEKKQKASSKKIRIICLIEVIITVILIILKIKGIIPKVDVDNADGIEFGYIALVVIISIPHFFLLKCKPLTYSIVNFFFYIPLVSVLIYMYDYGYGIAFGIYELIFMLVISKKDYDWETIDYDDIFNPKETEKKNYWETIDSDDSHDDKSSESGMFPVLMLRWMIIIFAILFTSCSSGC